MANTFLNGIDTPAWMQTTPHFNTHSAGMGFCADLRRDASRQGSVFALATNTAIYRYSITGQAWQQLIGTAFPVGTFGVGIGLTFAPSFGAVGTIAAGATTTKLTLSTALSAAVAANAFAVARDDGSGGFRIRIIDTVAGKTEERLIVANSAGTTPTIRVNNPFTFTPATGARYELLHGRVLMMGGNSTAAGSWRSYDPITGALTSLAASPLATATTETLLLALDEAYVPFDCWPGEGMIKGSTVYDTDIETRNALLATASGASTLTGQATGGDAAVVINEYRNFQIRIVADPTTPASVGQRRIIASHTAGPSAVYTLGAAWTVQPSSSARFVIEQPNLLIYRGAGSTTVHVYNYSDATINNGTNSIAANTWSTTYFAAAPAAFVLGSICAPSFGIRPDADKNARHSHLYFFRGGGTTLDLLDIAGSITGTWTAAIAYTGAGPALAQGTVGAYAPWGNEGEYLYLQFYVASSPNTMYRFNVKKRVLSPFASPDAIAANAPAVGQRLVSFPLLDSDGSVYAGLLLHYPGQTTVVRTIMLM